MSGHGEQNAEVQSLRARTDRDRSELSDTVEELAAKLDVKQQATRARAALSGSAVRWLRGHRPATAFAAAGAAAMLLFVYVWRRRRR